MGKIKHRRQTYHLVSKEKKNKIECMDMDELNFEPEIGQKPSISDSLFSGLVIPKELLLKQKLPLEDHVTETPVEPKLSKKEKRNVRHEKFLQKIEGIKLARKKNKEAIRRSKTAVVGDMKILENALPTLEQLLKESKKPDAKEQQNPTKFRSIKKAKVRQNEYKKGVKLFKQVWNHPAFKKDPDGTISDHLQNTVKGNK